MTATIILPATLYIISAPSGAGKTSLVNALVAKTDNVCVSVSFTTRLKRPGEEEGIAYHFVDKATFEHMISDHVFLEYAQVFDNYYGTSREWVEKTLQQGCDVILEIDWQGARQIRSKVPGCVTIFIVPPSKQALKQRLHKRGQDDPVVIERRMQQLKNEMSHSSEFDYLVVNDDFDQALTDLQAIMRSQRLRGERQQVNYRDLLTDLKNE